MIKFMLMRSKLFLFFKHANLIENTKGMRISGVSLLSFF